MQRDQQCWQQNRAEGIDVPHGIERQSLGVLRRRITKKVRHPSVAHFVQDDRRQERYVEVISVEHRDFRFSRAPEGARCGIRVSVTLPPPRCKSVLWRLKRAPEALVPRVCPLRGPACAWRNYGETRGR